MTALELPLGELTSSYSVQDDRVVHELTYGDSVRRSTMRPGVVSGDPRGDWWRSYLQGSLPESDVNPGASVSVVDLFCGSGGLSQGFKTAARELGLSPSVAAAADQDAEAVDVYVANHRPSLALTKSISTFVDFRVKGVRESARFHYEPEIVHEAFGELIGTVDVLLAGPPCQGHSNLNNVTRRRDKRNELYLTVPAIAVALGVQVVIIENVPEVLRDHKGVVTTTVRLLEESGYHVTSSTLNAAKLGWPQRRRRFFLVARRDRAPLSLDVVASALADEARSTMWAIEDLVDVPQDDFMFRQPELSEENRQRVEWLFDNDAYDLALSERPDCHQDGTTYMSVYGRMHPDEPAQTITTGFMTPGRGRYVHPTRRRVINPREAARLQGFPDTYDFAGGGDELPSTAKLCKWIGDAVPMPLGYAATLAALAPGPLVRDSHADAARAS